MGPAHDNLAASLARQADDLVGQLDAAAPDIDKALALFGRAATVSGWAAAADETVNHLDAIIDRGYYMLAAVGRSPRLLFPPAPALLEAMSFLAWSYLDRFEHRLDFFDLDEAHRYASEVLTLAGSAALPDPIRVRVDLVIAQVVDRRFSFTGNPEFLHEAIERLERVIELQPDAVAIAALAASLRRRAELSGGESAMADLQRAHAMLQDIVNPGSELARIFVYPILRARWLSELGRVHLAAARLFHSDAELQAAREICREAVDEWPASGPARLALAQVENDANTYFEVLRGKARSGWISLEAAEPLARLAAASSRSELAARSSAFAWQVVQQAIDNQIEESYKKVWLPRLVKATAVAVPANANHGNTELAVEFVESSRTRLLQEKFPGEDRELLELGAAGHYELSTKIRQALSLLRKPGSSAHTRARARDELAALTNSVRQIPGMAAFRSSPKPADIAAVLDAPVVYLVPGEPAGAALFVLPNENKPLAAPLPACSLAPPRAIETFRQASFSGYLPAGARRAAIDAVCDWAWDAIYQPLREVLASWPYVHVIGASYLALLPLHAARTRAGSGWRYASEDLEFRYIPSARALMAAKKRQMPEVETKFMLIPQPAGAGADLGGARSEVAEIAAWFQSPLVLPEEGITAGGISQAIGSVGCLHAACHGIADAEDPLASGLVLRDGERFTVRDLFTANQGHLLLTVLSACQTNVPDIKNPDEATSLAAGLSLGGCRAVIASAWQVPDAATSALIRLFYQRWRGNGDDLPAALRNAQLAFARGAGAVPEWRSEWVEPYFWAGFSYLGP